MSKIFAAFKDSHGKIVTKLYEGPIAYESFYKDTFSPLCEEIFFLDLCYLPGLPSKRPQTYKEKQAALRSKAIEFSNSFCEMVGISYYELYEIQNYFYKYGKRYGLLSEFRENAIC